MGEEVLLERRGWVLWKTEPRWACLEGAGCIKEMLPLLYPHLHSSSFLLCTTLPLPSSHSLIPGQCLPLAKTSWKSGHRTRKGSLQAPGI